MLSKFATRAIKASTARIVFDKTAVRAFAGHAAPAAADHAATHAPAQNKEGAHGTKQRLDIVVPDLYDSLEWCLTSPPPIHQFEEPPIVVEIEHLDNLVVPEDV